MIKKTNLLSIGEMSKYTGVSIRSLRYYEKINVLTPTFVDPDSGYRYYSIDQINLVWVIMFCIEIDIPLKEVLGFIGTDNKLNLRALIEQGEALAKSKVKTLNKGLKLFDEIRHQMNLSGKYVKGQVYTREIKEKFFCVKSYNKSQSNINQLDIIKIFAELPLPEDYFDGLTEYGFMCEYSSNGVEPYVFVELTKNLMNHNVKAIPSGVYFCCLGDKGQIGRVYDIFKNQLSNNGSFLAIETEIVTEKYEPLKPLLSELRILLL